MMIFSVTIKYLDAQCRYLLGRMNSTAKFEEKNKDPSRRKERGRGVRGSKSCEVCEVFE